MYALFAKIGNRWKYYGLTQYKEDADQFQEFFNDETVEDIKVVNLDAEEA